MNENEKQEAELNTLLYDTGRSEGLEFLAESDENILQATFVIIDEGFNETVGISLMIGATDEKQEEFVNKQVELLESNGIDISKICFQGSPVFEILFTQSQLNKMVKVLRAFKKDNL